MDILLRPWQPSDRYHLCQYANNEKISANLRNVFPFPYTLEDADAYIQYAQQADPMQEMIRAIVVAKQAVGSIGVIRGTDVHCKTAEIGFWLGEPFWGNGIMTTAIKRISTEAFRSFALCRIFAEVYAHNKASRRALEKAGYQLEGLLRRNIYKNGAVFDSCIYALVR